MKCAAISLKKDVNRPERRVPRRLLPRRRVLQHRANLGCSRRVDASTPRAATTSGSRGGSSTGSASASSSAITAGAGQIDGLLAVGIDEPRIGSLLQKVTNQVRPARLGRSVESRRTFFVWGSIVGDPHGVGPRAGDLSIHIGAML